MIPEGDEQAPEPEQPAMVWKAPMVAGNCTAEDGVSVEVVVPVTYALPLASRASPLAMSLPLPERYVE